MERQRLRAAAEEADARAKHAERAAMAVERAAAASRGNEGGAGGSGNENAARVRQLEASLEAARAEADAREAAAIEERDNAVRCGFLWLWALMLCIRGFA